MSDPSQPTPPPPVPPVPPVPRYGEYAPEGYVPPRPAPGYENVLATPQHPAGVPKRKTWDLVLTIVLLAVGIFGMLFGVAYGVIFTNPALLDEALKAQGYPGFTGDPGPAAAVLIISHVVLYLGALGGSIPLLLRKRVAFWLPLAAGILAAIIFWTTVTTVLLSDPALVPGLTS